MRNRKPDKAFKRGSVCNFHTALGASSQSLHPSSVRAVLRSLPDGQSQDYYALFMPMTQVIVFIGLF